MAERDEAATLLHLIFGTGLLWESSEPFYTFEVSVRWLGFHRIDKYITDTHQSQDTVLVC